MVIRIKYGDQAFEKYVYRLNEMSNVTVLKMEDREQHRCSNRMFLYVW